MQRWVPPKLGILLRRLGTGNPRQSHAAVWCGPPPGRQSNHGGRFKDKTHVQGCSAPESDCLQMFEDGNGLYARLEPAPVERASCNPWTGQSCSPPSCALTRSCDKDQQEGNKESFSARDPSTNFGSSSGAVCVCVCLHMDVRARAHTHTLSLFLNQTQDVRFCTAKSFPQSDLTPGPDHLPAARGRPPLAQAAAAAVSASP